MTPFLLVHGAFRGGWAWSRVRPLLVAAGRDVHAPSLQGCGERAAGVEHVRGLETWVDELAALVEYEDLRDVVAVGHSQGGVVVSALAARIPERLGHLVFLDAAVPAPGERAVDLTPSGPAPGDLPAAYDGHRCAPDRRSGRHRRRHRCLDESSAHADAVRSLARPAS